MAHNYKQQLNTNNQSVSNHSKKTHVTNKTSGWRVLKWKRSVGRQSLPAQKHGYDSIARTNGPAYSYLRQSCVNSVPLNLPNSPHGPSGLNHLGGWYYLKTLTFLLETKPYYDDQWSQYCSYYVGTWKNKRWNIGWSWKETTRSIKSGTQKQYSSATQQRVCELRISPVASNCMGHISNPFMTISGLSTQWTKNTVQVRYSAPHRQWMKC